MDGVMDDADPIEYTDVDIQDPEFDDLREEFRSDLKECLQSWIEAGQKMNGGMSVLLKVYAVIVEVMSFMSAPDIVDEMTGR
jgi:hypothetical protein